MRILLVQSYLGRREKPIYPLGLALLAAVLKGREVKVIDPNVSDQPLAELKRAVEKFSPEIVGISIRNLDTTQIRDPFVYFGGLKATIKTVKGAAPGAGLVMGGSGFSLYAEELMARCPEIDCGVFLEGEETFPELVEKWPDLVGVKGLFIRKDGGVKFTGKPRFPQMEKIPFPDWKAVPISPYKDLLDAVGVQTKRGCAFKCAYCNYPILNGAAYRFRPPELVGEEIERMEKDGGLDRFIFIDSVFNAPREHAEAVLRELIRRGIKSKWTGWYNERALDRDFVKLALEAGCGLFSFSPDGFSDESLKALGKNARKSDILRVFKILKDFPGAKVGYNFFLNPPGASLSEALKLLWFSVKVRNAFRGRLVGFLLGSIRIEPDTAIHRRAVEEGLIMKDVPLLAESSEELMRLFYRPPDSKALGRLLNMYIKLRNLRHKLAPPRDICIVH